MDLGIEGGGFWGRWIGFIFWIIFVFGLGVGIGIFDRLVLDFGVGLIGFFSWEFRNIFVVLVRGIVVFLFLFF